MKTKELIRQLQEADPSGELECCVENVDILSVQILPAYYDDYLQVLIRDENDHFYNVIGAKYVGSGSKVVISPHSICDAIFENQDLPVEYVGVSQSSKAAYEKEVTKRRQETQDIGNDVELSFFTEYMLKRLSENFGEDEIRQVAKEFYNANMDYRDNMPKDIGRVKKVIDGEEIDAILSWNERRNIQWDKQILVDFADGKLILTLKEI